MISPTGDNSNESNPPRFKRSLAGALAAVCVIVLLTSCATVGHELPSDQVDGIVIGKTTQAEIQEMFGSPWRVGVEDGLKTWTYGKYKYKIFGESASKDLLVRFDKNNVVVSYSFNTTDR